MQRLLELIEDKNGKLSIGSILTFVLIVLSVVMILQDKWEDIPWGIVSMVSLLYLGRKVEHGQNLPFMGKK